MNAISPNRFEGKVVVVTGVSVGIGRLTASRFLAEGAMVVGVSRRQRELDEAAAELGRLGRFEPLIGDVGDVGTAERLAACAQQLGGADVLVNNAGICEAYDFTDITLEIWERHMRVNLTGPFLCSQALLPQLRTKAGASIINVASANGLVAEARLAHYNSSKGGLVMLTKSMALDLASLGIRVNAVAPGIIATPMNEEWVATHSQDVVKRSIPMGRRGLPEEVAGCIVFLASDDASYVTGDILICDGGQLVDNEAK